MRGNIKGPDAANRRNTAKDIREEICGAVKQKIEVSTDGTFAETLRLARERAQRARPQQVPQEAAPTESAVASEGAELGLEGESK